MAVDVVWYSGQAGGVKQLTTPQGSPAGATLFPRWALPWVTFMAPGLLTVLQLGLMFSPQPGASYSFPRQFHLDGIRDVSKALFQLWLYAEAMFQQWLSSQIGCQVSISHDSGSVIEDSHVWRLQFAVDGFITSAGTNGGAGLPKHGGSSFSLRSFARCFEFSIFQCMFAPSHVTCCSTLSFFSVFWGGGARVLMSGITPCAPHAVDSPCKKAKCCQATLRVLSTAALTCLRRARPGCGGLAQFRLVVVLCRSPARLYPHFSEQRRQHERPHVCCPSGLSLASRMFLHMCVVLFGSLNETCGSAWSDSLHSWTFMSPVLMSTLLDLVLVMESCRMYFFAKVGWCLLIWANAHPRQPVG